jgi:hypothetical protein
MKIAHAGGGAAKLAIDGGNAVQDVDIAALRAKLASQRAVFEFKP